MYKLYMVWADDWYFQKDFEFLEDAKKACDLEFERELEDVRYGRFKPLSRHDSVGYCVVDSDIGEFDDDWIVYEKWVNLFDYFKRKEWL